MNIISFKCPPLSFRRERNSLENSFLIYQEFGCGFLELCSLSVHPNHGVSQYQLFIDEKIPLVRNADKERPGRPRTARCEDRIQRAAINVQGHPQTSMRERSVRLGLPTGPLRRITNHLKLHPCKIQKTQELQIADHQRRSDVERDLLQLTSDDFISWLIMSDEAHFYLTGHVSKQNCRYWSADNPTIIHEHPLKPRKVTAWCGMTCERIICPYFFEDDNGRTVTVTGDSYRKYIQKYLLPETRDLDMNEMWFQQDGAPAHTARVTIEIRKSIFPK